MGSRSTKALALLVLARPQRPARKTDAVSAWEKTGIAFFPSAANSLTSQGNYAHAIDDYTEAMKLAPFANFRFDILRRGGAYEKLDKRRSP